MQEPKEQLACTCPAHRVCPNRWACRACLEWHLKAPQCQPDFVRGVPAWAWACVETPLFRFTSGFCSIKAIYGGAQAQLGWGVGDILTAFPTIDRELVGELPEEMLKTLIYLFQV